ncbi:MAG: DNA polymerase III subunit chi [Rhodospirillales bacterium]|nr:DNA polymerase III subunit chi [Rhodospirillales bacterium]
MTAVGFYHLTRTPLEAALPKLLEKARAAGLRVLVLTGSPERSAALDSLLWTYDPDSWLVHGTAKDGLEDAPLQPIWISDQDENRNQAECLVLVDGAESARLGDYARCLDLFDGRDEAAVAAARARWSKAKEAGHALTYWQQTESGGWSEKR